MSARVRLPCGHHVSEDWLMRRAAEIAHTRGRTLVIRSATGGAQPGAGRPRKIVACERCGAQGGTVEMRRHKCKEPKT